MTANTSRSQPEPRGFACSALAATLTVLVALVFAGTAAARTDLTHVYRLKRCHGRIHAGLTSEERRHASHYGRYKRISCRRARAIVRLIDHNRGAYPAGYSWQTPHGPSSSWPTVFHRILGSSYLAPDGYGGSSTFPGVAVVTFD